MHEYIVNRATHQPQATVQHMAPCQYGVVDPRIIEQMMGAIARGSQTQMSNSDAVNIVIRSEDEAPVSMYTDAYLQAGDAFAESLVGQSMMDRAEGVSMPQARGQYVAQRAPDMLAEALMSARDPRMTEQAFVAQPQMPQYII